MKYLILLLAICISSFGQIAYVNSVANDANGSSLSTVATAATNHTAGNLLVVVVGADIYCSAISFTVTDTAGNTYTSAVTKFNDNNSLVCEQIFYAKNITGSSSNQVTVTATLARPYLGLTVMQFSGVDTSSPLDATATNTGNSVSSITSGSFSTAVANEVIVAGGNAYQGSNGWGAGTGFTAPASAHTAFGPTFGEYQIVSTTQSGVTASYSFNGNTSAALEIGVATFKQAGAAPPASGIRHKIIQR